MNYNLLKEIGLDGLDLTYLFIVAYVLILILIIVVIIQAVKFKKLSSKYAKFMSGKNAKSLEKDIIGLYEDNKFLVVLKRSGLLTISGTKENEVTLYHQVFHYLHQKQEKVFVVHRLDKDTSGIVLFAKSEKVKNSLQEHWNDIVKSRKYVALIHGSIKKSGTIRNYLKQSLPYYMVPTYFIQMNSLPLTANGKIDKKALPSPIQKNNDKITLPKNTIEETS